MHDRWVMCRDTVIYEHNEIGKERKSSLWDYFLMILPVTVVIFTRSEISKHKQKVAARRKAEARAQHNVVFRQQYEKDVLYRYQPNSPQHKEQMRKKQEVLAKQAPRTTSGNRQQWQMEWQQQFDGPLQNSMPQQQWRQWQEEQQWQLQQDQIERGGEGGAISPLHPVVLG